MNKLPVKILKLVVVFTLLMSLGIMVKSSIIEIHADLFNRYFDYVINADKYELNRVVNVLEHEGKYLRFETYFINPVDFDNSIIRNIDISIINEIILPMALIIALTFAFSNNLFLVVSVSFITYLILALKVLAMVFDNTNEAFVLLELGIFSGVVYYVNVLISEIGTQVNYLIVVVVWLVVMRGEFNLQIQE